jgi:hypothetical protein
MSKIAQILAGVVLTAFASASFANNIQITSGDDKGYEVVFRVAHQMLGAEPVFSAERIVKIPPHASIDFELNDYDLAGIVPILINGHVIPSHINQFGQPQQCSVATNKAKSSGVLEVTLSDKKLLCKVYGGIFG